MTLSEKIILLSVTLWLSAIAFMAYAFIMQSRFQTILKTLYKKIDHLEKLLAHSLKEADIPPEPIKSIEPDPQSQKKTAPETTIKIDKNEPLSKYETVTLPDEININFVDR
ncbi:MAG: hypothetical protein IKS41_04375 [Alphaproteobacteria bacterium]|nr:hypothetical protein [Alphaproteobacteria bacterium]